MAKKTLFVQLQKADIKKRQVWGSAAIEQPDSMRPPEIMDYARSKPNFISWSENVRKSSGGKSLGNVRAMHGGEFVAVGKVIAMNFDDANKAVKIGVEVVDDGAWQKVQKGVYTGFSIGGRYGERWPDKQIKGATRYEAIPSEVSLVDVPCMPGATFEVIKMDGEKEMRKFDMAEEKETDVVEPTDEEDNMTSESEDSGNDQDESGGESEDTQEPVEKSDSESDAVPEGDDEALDKEDAVEQQSFTMDDVRAMIVDTLMELGLVQPAQEGQSQESALAMSRKNGGLRKAIVPSWKTKIAKIDKVDERLTKMQGLVDPLAKQFGMMKSDLGKIIDAIDTLEKRGHSGPVVRDLGTISPQSMADMQKVSILREMLKDAAPSTRQALETEISRLEIKAIQTNKITL